MAGNLGSSPPMTFLLLVVDFKGHIQHILMLLLVALIKVNKDRFTYLEAIQFVTQVLLFIEELLESVG